MQRTYTAPRWRVNLTTYAPLRRAVPVAVLLLAALAGVGVAVAGGRTVVGVAGCLAFGVAVVALARRGQP